MRLWYFLFTYYYSNKLFVICNVVRVIRGDRNTDKKVFRSIIFPTYAENRSVGYYFSPAFFNKYSFEPRDPFENRTYWIIKTVYSTVLNFTFLFDGNSKLSPFYFGYHRRRRRRDGGPRTHRRCLFIYSFFSTKRMRKKHDSNYSPSGEWFRGSVSSLVRRIRKIRVDPYAWNRPPPSRHLRRIGEYNEYTCGKHSQGRRGVLLW